jgi:membrane protease YdiL (CAAX protease family)
MQIYRLISSFMHQKQIQLTYPSQFALLLGLLGLGMILGNLVALALGSVILHAPVNQVASLLIGSEHIQTSRLLNTLASFLVFCTPALVLARIVDKKPFQWLGFSGKFYIKQTMLVVLIAFAGLILSGALGEINQMIPLPSKWATKAKALEAMYKQTMMAMATMKSIGDYLMAILVMAAAPALFEEVLFRGGFQTIIVGWTKNALIGILITSVLFSAIHFSFYGFLPRAALGMILGYVFYYSGNLWLNVFMHFLYNGFIVTQLYLATKQGKSIEKTMDENMPIWLGLVAVMGVLVLLQIFKKEAEQILSLNTIKEESIHASVAKDL